MKFKKGDIVYCIDTTGSKERLKENLWGGLKLNTPYIVSDIRIEWKDLKLKNTIEYYWTWSRFITKEEYNIKKVVEII